MARRFRLRGPSGLVVIALMGCGCTSTVEGGPGEQPPDPRYSALFDVAPAASVNTESPVGVWSGRSSSDFDYPVRIEIRSDRVTVGKDCGDGQFRGVTSMARVGETSVEMKFDNQTGEFSREVVQTPIEIVEGAVSDVLEAGGKRIYSCQASLSAGTAQFTYERARKDASLSGVGRELIKLTD